MAPEPLTPPPPTRPVSPPPPSTAPGRSGNDVGRSPGRVPQRTTEDRIIAGVASGLAAEAGVHPLLVRVAFVVLTASGGWGLALYVLAWALMPVGGSNQSDGRVGEGGTEVRSLGVAMTVLGILLLIQQIGVGFSSSIVWPVALVGIGAVALWTRLPIGASLGDGPFQLGSFDVARICGGLVLVAAGLTGFLVSNLEVAGVVGLLGLLVIFGGVATIFLPWWLRAAKDLAEERRLRIRSDERAEVAAHLHDSVLQTLALIQKQADDPATVASLARGQERELRRWLFNGSHRPDGLDFAEELRQKMADVEQLHGVPIDVVAVGTAELTQTSGALIAAAGEAATNAAKFSGAPSIDVFAEAGELAIEVFIRDRGCGFDVEAVADDRRGVAESIVGRMERAGGTAEIHSEIGAGTEVELRLERESRG